MIKEINYKLPYFFVQWHLTDRCNLKCKHCYGEYGENWNGENELNLEECKKIIEDYANWIRRIGVEGWIHFTGGEPLVREDIFDLLKICSDEGIKVRILTNGTLLRKYAQKLADYGVKSVSIGFDHYDANEFNNFRGNEDVFNRVCDGIKAAKEAGLKVVIGPTLNKKNLGCIEKIYELGHKLEVDEFHIHRLVELGRTIKNKDVNAVSKEELKSIITMLYEKYLNKEKPNVSIGGTLWPIMDDYTGLGGCIAGFTGLSILTDGQVFPCRLLPMNIGNVHKDSIEKIYCNSDILEKLRNRKLTGKKCSKCKYRVSCGGCRAIAYSETKNYLGDDKQCWLEV
ncbi:MAG: radical SAM protein [Clostridium sp.]|uniref:radical SAM protein n=1 Tax=Clostridium sp. TaxID=1506 RepID=UPI003EE7EA40